MTYGRERERGEGKTGEYKRDDPPTSNYLLFLDLAPMDQ